MRAASACWVRDSRSIPWVKRNPPGRGRRRARRTRASTIAEDGSDLQGEEIAGLPAGEGTLNGADPDRLQIRRDLDCDARCEAQSARSGLQEPLRGPVSEELDGVDRVSLRAGTDGLQQRGLQVEHPVDERSTVGCEQRGEADGGAAGAGLERVDALSGLWQGAEGFFLDRQHDQGLQATTQDPVGERQRLQPPLGIVRVEDCSWAEVVEDAGEGCVADAPIAALSAIQQVESL